MNPRPRKGEILPVPRLGDGLLEDGVAGLASAIMTKLDLRRALLDEDDDVEILYGSGAKVGGGEDPQ